MSKTLDALGELNQIRSTKFTSAAAKMHATPSSAVHAFAKTKKGGIDMDYLVGRGSSSHDSERPSPAYFPAILVVCVLLVAILSLVLNYRILSEVKRSKESSAVALSQINDQKQKIDTLERFVTATQKEFSSKITALQNESETLKGDLAAGQNTIAGLQKANQKLETELKDLEWSQQSLKTKLMELNQKIITEQK